MRFWVFVLCCVPLLVAFAQDAPKRKPEPTNFAPIAFFNKNCTYCHTKDGTSYADDFGARYDENALYARLIEMTDEKAHAPLTNRELDVLASWFRSLIKKEPYVAGVSSKDGVLTFESSLGAKVTTNAGSVKFEKGVWNVSGAASADTVTVTSTSGKKSTVLKLADGSVSHGKPVRR